MTVNPWTDLKTGNVHHTEASKQWKWEDKPLKEKA